MITFFSKNTFFLVVLIIFIVNVINNLFLYKIFSKKIKIIYSLSFFLTNILILINRFSNLFVFLTLIFLIIIGSIIECSKNKIIIYSIIFVLLQSIYIFLMMLI